MAPSLLFDNVGLTNNKKVVLIDIEDCSERPHLTSMERARKGVLHFLMECSSALAGADVSWATFSHVFNSIIVSWWKSRHEFPSNDVVGSFLASVQQQIQRSPVLPSPSHPSDTQPSPPSPPPPSPLVLPSEISTSSSAASPSSHLPPLPANPFYPLLANPSPPATPMLPPSSPGDEEEFLHVPDPGEETADIVCGYCMVEEGQDEHTEVEMKILKCASQANLTKDELIMVLKRVGGTKFKDFIDLRAEDFDGHGFLPLLKRRLCCFRSSLSRECWKLQEEVASRGCKRLWMCYSVDVLFCCALRI